MRLIPAKILLVILLILLLSTTSCARSTVPKDPKVFNQAKQTPLAGRAFYSSLAQAGYAEPNTFTISADELTKGESLTISVNEDYIYKHYYIAVNGQWQKQSFPQATTANSQWIKSSTSATLATENLNQGSNYAVVYSCTKTGSNWNCHNNKWQIHDFKILPAPIVPPAEPQCGSDQECPMNYVCVNSECIPEVPESNQTFYISPNGSDANLGTSNEPWKTWSFAVGKLNPGDTLIAKDGMYEQSTTGLPNIVCGVNAQNGIVNKPIMLLAENERKAHLKSDGSVSALKMKDCHYWAIKGFYGSGADKPDSFGSGALFRFETSSHLTIRKILAYHTNYYANDALVQFLSSSDSVLEDSEGYEFNRWGFQAQGTDAPGYGPSENIIFRRVYVNSRELYEPCSTPYMDSNGQNCPAGCSIASCNSGKNIGDEGIGGYWKNISAHGLIMENAIAENVNAGLRWGASLAGTSPNKVLGSITLNTKGEGVGTGADGEGVANVLIENTVAIGGSYGFIFNEGKNMQATKITAFKNTYGAYARDTGNNDPDRSTFFTNILTFNSGADGIYVANQDDYAVEYSNSVENAKLSSSYKNYNLPVPEDAADTDGNVQYSLSVTPTLMGLEQNQCIVYVPGGNDGWGNKNPTINDQSSNMAGAGKNGEDIGANIVYTYENGVPSNKKLWDQDSGEFMGCGAIVPGVNDLPGQSCFDLHQRLNVGVNGCPIP